MSIIDWFREQVYLNKMTKIHYAQYKNWLVENGKTHTPELSHQFWKEEIGPLWSNETNGE